MLAGDLAFQFIGVVSRAPDRSYATVMGDTINTKYLYESPRILLAFIGNAANAKCRSGILFHLKINYVNPL